MDDRRQQVTLRVYRDVAFAALDLLARVISALPPFSAVLALCESMIATLGVAFRPFALRPCSRVWATVSGHSSVELRASAAQRRVRERIPG